MQRINVWAKFINYGKISEYKFRQLRAGWGLNLLYFLDSCAKFEICCAILCEIPTMDISLMGTILTYLHNIVFLSFFKPFQNLTHFSSALWWLLDSRIHFNKYILPLYELSLEKSLPVWTGYLRIDSFSVKLKYGLFVFVLWHDAFWHAPVKTLAKGEYWLRSVSSSCEWFLFSHSLLS